ncbi:MAG: MFS transporter [Steroidobacteraceae bacterium]
MLGLNRYQWTVLLAAWLGWGFDIFDSLLFNYVAPNCVPTLLGLAVGSPAARSATLFWTGLLTSLLLVGWALGGVLFGHVCDRIGRLRTLMLTMLMYALGTAACAFATSIWMLMAFRLIASIGIGGEWAAGASMVAEVVPEKRRVEAGALLYTAAPMGLFLATFLNHRVAGVWFAGMPTVSWRYVFLFGLVPAAAAFVVRLFVREPERWQAAQESRASWRELFGPQHRRRTLWGAFVAIVALITWWSCNAFLPALSTGLARAAAAARGLDELATLALVEEWKRSATNIFNLGGLIGTLLTIPAAKLLGRRPMFALYFAGSAAAILATFGLELDAHTRLMMFFLIGLTVFGVFGAFTYYLPELYPTRLRASGAGFCYNIGRLLAAVGPFLVGAAAARGVAMQAIFWVGFVPLAALLLVPFYIETRGQALAD